LLPLVEGQNPNSFHKEKIMPADGLNNAFYTNKTPPLIKAASFTTLDEVEVAKMRTFLSIADARIQANEVFFYAPKSLNREIEGDDWPSQKLVSAGAGSYPGARRRKFERQNVDGSTTTVQDGLTVLWYNNTVSPAVFQQVSITLK
jgi:hypothetical protein